MARRAATPAPAWLMAIARHRSLFVPVAFILMIGVIVVPLPPSMMDVLLCLNITLAAVILLTTIYIREPLELSVFPALLLGVTLFRLVLNIATTRLILSADANSAAEATFVAGRVVQAFGDFVAGSSLAVGVILFAIIVVVQFVVITKGSTRISEVAARFTLDAMPGKQMAIDADLNAGMINEQQARDRRERLSDEADFFGAMDGASKFVRGDAIAGIIITVINIVGGFAIGAISKGWTMAESAEVFTRLTIGDGLASQLPALIISIAAGLLVTRSSGKGSLGDELADQLSGRPVALGITSVFLAALAMTPLPSAPLLAASVGLGGVAYYMSRHRRSAADAVANEQRAGADAAKPEPPSVESLLKVDVLELEVGYGLVPLVDTNQGGDLLDRISAIRRQIAVEMGLVMPPVRIRDNMTLESSVYRIRIRGAVVAEGHTHGGRLLAIDSGIVTGPIEGIPTREPAFNLDAWWIDHGMKARAEAMNYTVVDATSVLATHMTEVVKRYADELLTREEVNNLLTQLKEKAPKLVEEVVPGIVKPGDLQRVLQALLRERVPIRDLEIILETLAEWGGRTKDTDVLVEYVRHALRRVICQQHASAAEPGAGDSAGRPRIVCVTLDPAFEDMVNGYIDRSSGATSVTMPARVASRASRRIIDALTPVTASGRPPVVIASPQVRAVVRQIMEPHLPNIIVLGYNEIVSEVEVESMGLVTPPTEASATTAA
ncbi:MAG: flagellar biosynthesis protein FlhA [Phycisphaerales bacterium]|nr:MAG: flagellar biosynthesis protein FlhA [Phycisphaerales bacterium]